MNLTIPCYLSLNRLTRDILRTKVMHYSRFGRVPPPESNCNVQSFQSLIRDQSSSFSVSSSSSKRQFHWKHHRSFSTGSVLCADAEMADVTFITSDGTKLKTKGKVGDNLLDVVVNNSVDLDGFGACEGTLACSTCHLVFKQADFDKIKDKITDEELDMLDLAYGLCDTSRLGCQVTLTKELAGVEVEVPAGVNDARS